MRRISEGSCDTESRSNGCWKFQLRHRCYKLHLKSIFNCYNSTQYYCTSCVIVHNIYLLTVIYTLVKKKYGKFSNLMNIGKKKVSSLESPEKTLDMSGNQSSILLVDKF